MKPGGSLPSMISVAGFCLVLTWAACPLLGISACNHCTPACSGMARCGRHGCRTAVTCMVNPYFGNYHLGNCMELPPAIAGAQTRGGSWPGQRIHDVLLNGIRLGSCVVTGSFSECSSACDGTVCLIAVTSHNYFWDLWSLHLRTPHPQSSRKL